MPIDIENFTMIQGHKKTGIKPNVVANTVILTPFSKHDHKGCTKFIEIVLSPNLVFKIVVKFGTPSSTSVLREVVSLLYLGWMGSHTYILVLEYIFAVC